jgi:hypothetical protein
METPLLGGESVEGYEESEGGAEEKPESGREEDIFFVEGEPHWIKAEVSIKTLAYYEYTASRMNTGDGSKLTRGNFIDICVDDFFKGRNLSLGLVQPEEKKEGKMVKQFDLPLGERGNPNPALEAIRVAQAERQQKKMKREDEEENVVGYTFQAFVA